MQVENIFILIYLEMEEEEKDALLPLVIKLGEEEPPSPPILNKKIKFNLN